MVTGFRRSISFPNPNAERSSSPEKSYHVRSISLPCRSHPLISELNDQISELRTWESKSDTRTLVWLCEGLSQLKSVHDSLDDLLQLPQTQESLRHRSDWVDKLLEDCIRFVDVYGIFRAVLVDLKEEQLAAQVAIRRRDESKIASYMKTRKNMDKEMAKLVSVVRCIGRSSVPVSVSVPVSDDDDAELAGILRDVNEVTVSVSISLFNGISSSSSKTCKSWMGWRLSRRRTKMMKKEKGIRELEEVIGVESLWGLRKQGDEEVRMALRRMQALEECIGGIESGSERVFRSLINTRVSLLNVLTQ